MQGHAVQLAGWISLSSRLQPPLAFVHHVACGHVCGRRRAVTCCRRGLLPPPTTFLGPAGRPLDLFPRRTSPVHSSSILDRRRFFVAVTNHALVITNDDARTYDARGSAVFLQVPSQAV